jgi:antitoxin HicB
VEYSVIVHKAEDSGYRVEVPALPGCYSQGQTLEETLEHIKEAIQLYLEVLREDGHPIPRDEEVVFKVSVAA